MTRQGPLSALVTGSAGFVGRNLCHVLNARGDVTVTAFDVTSPCEVLEKGLAEADIVYHLAGVNRPQKPGEFQAVNGWLTSELCDRLGRLGRRPTFVLASSVQAELENPYGLSKRAAEEAVRTYCRDTGAPGIVYRLKNLFGKWSRPNYNSVVATFCHNIARRLPIEVSNPANVVDLTYIDEVIEAFVGHLAPGKTPPTGCRLAAPLPSHRITLGELAKMIESFRDERQTLLVPDVSLSFVRALRATYLSYLPTDEFAYELVGKTDARGSLAEFLKSPALGQIFVSRTRPGVTRGNHYHHTKTEKFLVVQGEASIRLRNIADEQVTELRVRGEDYRVVDIPPGYTHSIENVGQAELVTLFWASEIFDPEHPDTMGLDVLSEKGSST